jgi:hypothetical protein
MEMVALKRVKYPHGPTGKEYTSGESFTALSERDAKGLYISGKARYGAASNKTDLPKPAKVEEAPVEPEAPLHQFYQTRHMEAGPIGEEQPSPSSRPGRRPRKRNSDDSEE